VVRATDDILFVLAGVVIAKKPVEFVKVDSDLGVEL